MARIPKAKKVEIAPSPIPLLLQEGPRSSSDLLRLLKESSSTFDPKLERQLKQLRKEGKIHLIGKRWSLVTVVTCPNCEGRGWVDNKVKPPI